MTPERDHMTCAEHSGETDLRAWLVRTLPQWSQHDTSAISAQLFAFLARATHDGVLVEDPGREVIYMNPRLASWVDLGNGNILPDHLSLDGCLSHVLPDTLESRDMLEDRSEGHAFKVDWVTERGANLPMDMRFVPFRDADGHYAGGMGLLRPAREESPDATPYFSAPEAPNMPASGSGIGHDFNNLMAVILSNAEILQRRLGENSAAEKLMGNVLDAGRQAGRLARRIVNQARRGNATRQLLNLNEILQELVGLEHYLVTQSIRVEMDTAAQLWHLCGDPAQLERVIVSLATNAAEAMPKGGVLTVRTANLEQTEERALYSGILRPGRHVVLEICDTGCGISPDATARIFEPYYSAKEFGRGTGLSTVLQIVREHDGALDYSSEVGAGSRFSVYLPTLSPANSVLPKDRAKRHEVVVCGSDVTLTGTTKRMLARLGYYPTILQNPAEVPDFCASHDLAACVLLLPAGVSATEQCNQVRKLKKAMPGAHMLAIGSAVNPATADALLNAGADSHLTVPFRLQDIAAKLGSVLEHGRLE